MQFRLYIFISFTLLTTLIACVAEPQYPDEPQIDYVRVSESEKRITGTDITTTITVSFTDGDGDLGYDDDNNPSCSSISICDYTSDSSCFNDPYWDCFLIDSRDSCYQFFRLPYLTPKGKVKAITGEIDIKALLFPKPDLGPGVSYRDTVRFGVIIRDRNGNMSNTAYTEPIIFYN